MVLQFTGVWQRVVTLTRHLRADTRGQIAIMFAVSSIAIILSVGAAIDLARAYSAQLKLSEVATLACQYANRPSVYNTATGSYTTNSNGYQTYQTAVNGFIATSLTSQKWNAPAPTGTQFTATPAGPSNPTGGPTNGRVQLLSSVPTTFMQIAQIFSVPVSATMPCYSSTNNTPPTPNGNNPFLVKESFESAQCTACYYTFQPNGTTNQPTNNPTSSISSSPTYQGVTNAWYVIGYCLETDALGVINSTVPDGNMSAELDCENGTHTAGNSSISTEVFLPVGSYELRYNYRSRVDYSNYDPAYICGSTASDVTWANDTNAQVPFTGALRTNQINTYLDLNTTGAPPTHKTLDGTLTLGGSNLIDSCVYSPNWIERSVRVTVTTAGYYWLSFAADGANDSFGGQIDNLRLCMNNCPGTPQDNFPTAWTTSPNLFEDTFELPVYIPTYSNYIAINGNLALSKGTTGTLNSGWPYQLASGWATAPYNQVNYFLRTAPQGSQYIGIDGNNGVASAPVTSPNSTTNSTSQNRLISRPFLLDPGYYQVSYNYVAEVDFGASAGQYGTFCTAAPTSGAIYPAVGSGFYQGLTRFTATPASRDITTNILGVFMAHSLLVSTPNTNIIFGATTTYANPDGSTSTTPTAPPDAVNWQSYNAAANNPVIDTCGNADSYRTVPRTASVKITKPGYYWLTFSANGGASDGKGPNIDDVKLTALGGPYSTAPSSGLTLIPSPAPASDTVYNNSNAFIGFHIVADPFSPPAAAQ